MLLREGAKVDKGGRGGVMLSALSCCRACVGAGSSAVALPVQILRCGLVIRAVDNSGTACLSARQHLLRAPLLLYRLQWTGTADRVEAFGLEGMELSKTRVPEVASHFLLLLGWSGQQQQLKAGCPDSPCGSGDHPQPWLGPLPS